MRNYSANNSGHLDKKLSNNFGLPNYTQGEEMFNAVTHGLGVIFSVVAWLFLLVNYPRNIKNVFAFSIYGATLLILYTISTLYHSFRVSKIKSNFRKLDHCSIFLLIAGTYTPICMLLTKGTASRIVLISVWIAAAIGIALNLVDVNKFSKVSLACYIFMGWSIIFMTKPALMYMSFRQLRLLLIGGMFYTVGAVIYVLGKKVKYMHSIWHLFVLAGSVYHFMVLV